MNNLLRDLKVKIAVRVEEDGPTAGIFISQANSLLRHVFGGLDALVIMEMAFD